MNFKTYLALAFVVLLLGCTSAPQNQGAAGYGQLSISCPSSEAVIGQTYSGIISATGGTGQGYTISFSGNLPIGIAPQGQYLLGTPASGTKGSYEYTITLQDSSGASASESCAMNVTQVLWRCGINKVGAFESQSACGLYCAGSPTNCELLPEGEDKQPAKPDAAIVLLTGILFIVVLVAVFIVFDDLVFKTGITRGLVGRITNPDKQPIYTFDSPVFFAENGRYYDYADDRKSVRYGDATYIKQRLRTYRDTNDYVNITGLDYACSLTTLDKYDKKAEIIPLPLELAKARRAAFELNGECAALRTALFRIRTANTLQEAKDMATYYKSIKESVGGDRIVTAGSLSKSPAHGETVGE